MQVELHSLRQTATAVLPMLLPQAGYGAVPPPNPYGQQQPTQADTYAGSQGLQSHPNPLVNEILGGLQYAPTALQIINADPNIPREKLEHLKVIMEGDPNTRTDIGGTGLKSCLRSSVNQGGMIDWA